MTVCFEPKESYTSILAPCVAALIACVVLLEVPTARFPSKAVNVDANRAFSVTVELFIDVVAIFIAVPVGFLIVNLPSELIDTKAPVDVACAWS